MTEDSAKRRLDGVRLRLPSGVEFVTRVATGLLGLSVSGAEIGYYSVGVLALAVGVQSALNWMPSDGDSQDVMMYFEVPAGAMVFLLLGAVGVFEALGLSFFLWTMIPRSARALAERALG